MVCVVLVWFSSFFSSFLSFLSFFFFLFLLFLSFSLIALFLWLFAHGAETYSPIGPPCARGPTLPAAGATGREGGAGPRSSAGLREVRGCEAVGREELSHGNRREVDKEGEEKKKKVRKKREGIVGDGAEELRPSLRFGSKFGAVTTQCPPAPPLPPPRGRGPAEPGAERGGRGVLTPSPGSEQPSALRLSTRSALY